MGLEDFTLNTNLDPGGHLTSIAAHTIDFTDLDYNGDCYSYFNYGVGHFNFDISHRLNFEITASDVGGLVSVWLLSNDVDDIKGLIDAGKYFQEIRLDSQLIRLINHDSGGTSVDSYAFSLNTRYYLNPYWIGSTVYCGIYSDSNYSILLHTLSVGFIDDSYENLFSINNFNNGTPPKITGDVSDLDLQEFNGFPFFFDGGHY